MIKEFALTVLSLLVMVEEFDDEDHVSLNQMRGKRVITEDATNAPPSTQARVKIFLTFVSRMMVLPHLFGPDIPIDALFYSNYCVYFHF